MGRKEGGIRRDYEEMVNREEKEEKRAYWVEQVKKYCSRKRKMNAWRIQIKESKLRIFKIR